MDVIRTGDILVVTALERLGRDTLGLLGLVIMDVERKVLDMPVTPWTWLVAVLWSPPE